PAAPERPPAAATAPSGPPIHRTPGGASDRVPSASEGVFLDRLVERLRDGVPTNAAHPMPPPVDRVPTIGYRRVSSDLLASFVAMAEAVGARVHLVGDDVPEDLLADLVVRHQVARVVATAEPEVASVAETLRGLGPRVLVGASSSRRVKATAADLGVTSASALVAATGSLVLDCAVVGDRTASLLPRVHLCVVPVDRLVASPGDVLRAFDDDPTRLPSNLVLITGPSRTGDIEQLLTIGVHGPTAVEIVVTGTSGPGR
ncbi:MAG: hypothetical protein JWM05_3487, partial [Acidimicrobiales bacterium]|nr:hypothetical protein [Acidimicrobiales bacterium]